MIACDSHSTCLRVSESAEIKNQVGLKCDMTAALLSVQAQTQRCAGLSAKVEIAVAQFPEGSSDYSEARLARIEHLRKRVYTLST